MKIAIFENEFHLVKIAFDAVNTIYYNDTLQFKVYKKSQDLKTIEKIKNYDLIIVDIDLSSKSQMNGFEIIKSLKENNIDKPIIVLTGSSKIKEQLDEMNFSHIPIIIKPITYSELYEKLNKYLPSSKVTN